MKQELKYLLPGEATCVCVLFFLQGAGRRKEGWVSWVVLQRVTSQSESSVLADVPLRGRLHLYKGPWGLVREEIQAR